MSLSGLGKKKKRPNKGRDFTKSKPKGRKRNNLYEDPWNYKFSDEELHQYSGGRIPLNGQGSDSKPLSGVVWSKAMEERKKPFQGDLFNNERKE